MITEALQSSVCNSSAVWCIHTNTKPAPDSLALGYRNPHTLILPKIWRKPGRIEVPYREVC